MAPLRRGGRQQQGGCRRGSRAGLPALLGVLLLLAGACNDASQPTPTPANPPTAPANPPAAPTPPATPRPTLGPGGLSVFAAASLQEAFSEAGRNFKAANPNITNLQFNFAGS